MKNKSIYMHLTGLIIAALLLSCDKNQDNGQPTAIAITDFSLQIPSTTIDPSGCTSEKPQDIGCTTLCKPCVTFVCKDGEWVRLPVLTPEQICNPPDRPGDPGPSACPRTDTGFCPAECGICF